MPTNIVAVEICEEDKDTDMVIAADMISSWSILEKAFTALTQADKCTFFLIFVQSEAEIQI